MAELTWDQLLSDNQTYPDTMVWTFENGSQASLGTLRHQMQQAQQAHAEVTHLQQQNQGHQQREQEATARAQRAEQQLIQLLSTPQQQDIPMAQTLPDFWQTDPSFKPMMDKVTTVQQENANLKAMLADMQNMQRQMYSTVQQIPIVMSVQKIQATDPTTDGAKLLEFARDHNIQPHRLEDAHLLMTRERDMQAAIERGKQQGLEQARAELASQIPQTPYAPYGPQGLYIPPQQQFTTVDQAMDAAMQDPDVIAAWMNPA